MMCVVTDRVAPQQRLDMPAAWQPSITLAVDIRRRIVAGGGALHADCEAALIDDGSRPPDVRGADWIPESRAVRCESLINIRPQAGTRSLSIQDRALRATIEAIGRERFAA